MNTTFVNNLPHLSNCWGDFDNDGDQDVFIASDNTTSKYYRNNNNGTFTLLNQSITAPAGNSCIISCDYDNDGDLDIFVHGSNAARSLYRNDTVAAAHNWLVCRLKGTLSNASAIGARIYVKALIAGTPRWQLRTVTAQNSFQGQNDLRQHFGLADAGQVDSVKIFWPSGLNEVYVSINLNQHINFVEGSGTLVSAGTAGNTGSPLIFPNPATETIKIVSPGNYTTLHVGIFDASGKLLMANNYKAGEEIRVDSLKEGSYLLRIGDGTRHWFAKFLVRR